jgi:hypothetical protein
MHRPSCGVSHSEQGAALALVGGRESSPRQSGYREQPIECEEDDHEHQDEH